jgi:hypothetical protein
MTVSTAVTKSDLILMAEQRRKLRVSSSNHHQLYNYVNSTNGKAFARVGSVLQSKNRIDNAIVVMDVVFLETGVKLWVININKVTGDVLFDGSCTWVGGSEIEEYTKLADDYVEYLDNVVIRELEAKLQEAEKELEKAKQEVDLKEISVMLLKEQIYK